jgi:transposase
MGTVAQEPKEREGRPAYRRHSAEFKRQQVERLLRGEVTIAELSRELGIARSLIQRWKLLLTKGGETAVGSNEDVVPASALRAAEQRIRELERALGRKQMAIEILEAAQDEVKKKPTWYGVSKRGRSTP